MKEKLKEIGFYFDNKEKKEIIDENVDVWRFENNIIITTAYLKYTDVHLEYMKEQFQNGDVGQEAVKEVQEDYDLMKKIRNLNFSYEGKLTEEKNRGILENKKIGIFKNKSVLGCFI